MRSAIKAWLPLAVLATCIYGAMFFLVQQMFRQSANDPQIQLAEDWAGQIVSGTDANRLTLGAFIDPARSLAPFGIVYDQDGNIVASSVSAPSTMKQPDGVYDAVDAAPNKTARYTWQPASGERYAVVLQRATFEEKSYYVLAGRNLRAVDERVGRAAWITVAVWVATLLAIAVAQNLHLVARAVRRGKNNGRA